MSHNIAAKLPYGTLTKLAGADYSVGHIKRVLAGERRPSLELAEALAAAGYPVWHLYPELAPVPQQLVLSDAVVLTTAPPAEELVHTPFEDPA